MYTKIILMIAKDIKNIVDLKLIEDYFYLHYYLCRYIRNKYSWNNKFLKLYFQKCYNIEDVDDISFLILKDVLKKIKVEPTF